MCLLQAARGTPVKSKGMSASSSHADGVAGFHGEFVLSVGAPLISMVAWGGGIKGDSLRSRWCRTAHVAQRWTCAHNSTGCAAGGECGRGGRGHLVISFVPDGALMMRRRPRL